jgi:hypothetical protein
MFWRLLPHQRRCHRNAVGNRIFKVREIARNAAGLSLWSAVRAMPAFWGDTYRRHAPLVAEYDADLYRC